MTIRTKMTGLSIVVAGMMLAVGPALAITTNTWNGSVSSTASVDGNWTLNHTPLPSEAILLDGTSSGTTTVSGAISANGAVYPGHGGGAGGSVFLTSGWLTGNGTLRANGGISFLGGGGGRVAIILTGTGAGFDNWTGTNTAYGGSNNPGAAGTVYRAATGIVAGGGSVVVDNYNVATNASYTALPAFSNSVENLRASLWTLRSKARVVMVTNAAIESLTINTNSYLDLAGHTLTLNSLTITNSVIKGGTYTASQLAPLVSDSSPGLTGLVIIPTHGTLFFIQ